MKVLFVSEYYPPQVMGGGEINLSLLTEALAKRSVEVTVLTSFYQEALRYEEKKGVKICRFLKTGSKPEGILTNVQRSYTFPRSVIKEVKCILKKEKYDLLHFIGTSVIAAPALRNLGIPLVATIESYPALCPKGDRIFHGKEECRIRCSFASFYSCQKDSKEIGKTKNTAFLKYNPFALSYIYSFHKQLQRSLPYCNLIAISTYMQKLLLQHGFKSSVIPNAIDVQNFKIFRKKENEIPAIVYLGSLIKSKGPHLALQAVKGLPCHFDLYGDGSLREDLQKTIEKENIPATIHQPVPKEKVPEIYALADMVLFPSLWPEPFGRIAIEAMGGGKPIIYSAIKKIK